MNPDTQNLLYPLKTIDPGLAEAVSDRLNKKNCPVSAELTQMLVDETLWALNREISFGCTLAIGYADLIAETHPDKISTYRQLVHKAADHGPTLGRIVAISLVPVLKHGNERLLDDWVHVLDIMKAKGTYTLKQPLDALGRLLEAGDSQAASVYLALLADTFSNSLSYEQCRRLASDLPGAVLNLAFNRRARHIQQLHRVIKTDVFLAEPFLAGLARGLHLLTERALADFVTQGLKKYHRDKTLGARFLSLESKTGLDVFSRMQVAVSLHQVQRQLNRYVQARTGLPISIRPQACLSRPMDALPADEPTVCSDGKFIYLPDVINRFPRRHENVNLYKMLTRLESAFYEFHTIDFDLEKALDRCRFQALSSRSNSGFSEARCRAETFQIPEIEESTRRQCCDLECFFALFPLPELAADLFTIFEQARIRVLLARKYPGLVRQSYPVLKAEALRIFKEQKPNQALFRLYARLALDIKNTDAFGAGGRLEKSLKEIADRFESKIRPDSRVEISAELVFRSYPQLSSWIGPFDTNRYLKGAGRFLPTPFDWRPRPNRYTFPNPEYDRRAALIKVRLAEKGLAVYKSDVKKRLLKNDGVITLRDIRELTGTLRLKDIAINEVLQIFSASDFNHPPAAADSGAVFWYPEWDCRLSDYLQHRVRVVEQKPPGIEDEFYGRTLARREGLIRNLRYAFEMLKPEGLKILRQWLEGEEFDYRALLDFAVDRKAGILPSERLYIKRIKKQRDVAVLLLVDLSRSTANKVWGLTATVLDVEKEAIILFSEALEVLGDVYALAGFSGTGRLGVDFFWLKDFEEEMGAAVRGRINALSPKRNTRMGAAVRHAAHRLEQVASRVRLLIILGDGFPNDGDYKQKYAVADTHQAILEVRSKNIYTHAITVNPAADPKLDDLYGNVHHTVISDVRELPDKLLRIYRSLTR